MRYKELFRLENGTLLRNTENKIVYVDEQGIKRVKTNPTLKDFVAHGIKPVRYEEAPQCDFNTQVIKEKIVEGLDDFTVKYEIEEVDKQ
jgi:hypothetical protein